MLLSLAAFASLSLGAPSPEGYVLARQGVDRPATPPTAARALSRTIFLNRRGVTITPGANDAEHNRSSVTTKLAAIPAWEVDEETWTQTVDCLKTMFSAYDVTFTETDPGTTPHMEAVFGGSPELLGIASRIAGVAPLATNCSVIESSMVFTFTEVVPRNAQLVCEIQAQEIAHSFGLDHEVLAPDPMSYLRFDGERAFQDQLAECGESTPRPCGINGNVCRDKQNSHALLLERLGAAGTTEPSDPRQLPTPPPATDPPADLDPDLGCNAGGAGSGLGAGVIALLASLRRTRRRASAR